MIAAVTVLMIAHLAEIMVWALTYAILGVTPEGSDLVYFAFVNYTTPRLWATWTPGQALEFAWAMTAMNGVLLFGWSMR